MLATFYIPGDLRVFTAGAATVELDLGPSAARTVGDALAALYARHPGVRDRVHTETGELRRHVNVFVGAESIRYTGGLETPLPAGPVEISIIPAVSGG